MKQLTLTNFKNYAQERIAFGDSLNCITGQNGMGKTNLLDAIYYLCMGKSYFAQNEAQIAFHESDFFRIEARIDLEGKEEKIVAKVIPRRQKIFERNDVAYKKISEHVGTLPVVIIAPDDTQIVTEGSEARRRFLDNTLCQFDPAYLQQLIVYERILDQRNALLKRLADQPGADRSLLRVYAEQLVAPAEAIHKARVAFVRNLRPVLQSLYEKISGGKEEIDCQYQSQLDGANFSTLLQQREEKDCILQRTTSGIHRDDLIFIIGGHPLKHFASQGQLKSFVLSLKLAQYEWLKTAKNTLPFLLLDDIFDKLDAGRVAMLMELLCTEVYGQVFITDTDEDRVAKIAGSQRMPFLKLVIDKGTTIKNHETDQQ
ncbi:MAG: DNA replication/repair protein RecF [Saprospiraceae bacterium]|nr:DNA replication/repair protein RecF [Saprospiraceae bacterium]